VEKNSSPSEGSGEAAQPYEPVRFDADTVVVSKNNNREEEKREKEKREKEKREKERLARIEKEAFDKGFARGIQEGSQTIDAVAGRLDSIVTELEDFRRKKIGELIPDMINLSIEIAKKIIYSSIEKDRENVIAVTRDALARLGATDEKILIRVNPEDYDTMLTNLDSLRGETRLMDITIEPSASITPGGCFIESRTGEVDARVEEMIREIGDAISTASNS
jgi:flagellar biosynthesis/type III secretory pathway protein FliH